MVCNVEFLQFYVKATAKVSRIILLKLAGSDFEVSLIFTVHIPSRFADFIVVLGCLAPNCSEVLVQVQEELLHRLGEVVLCFVLDLQSR